MAAKYSNRPLLHLANALGRVALDVRAASGSGAYQAVAMRTPNQPGVVVYSLTLQKQQIEEELGLPVAEYLADRPRCSRALRDSYMLCVAPRANLLGCSQARRSEADSFTDRPCTALLPG